MCVIHKQPTDKSFAISTLEENKPNNFMDLKR